MHHDHKKILMALVGQPNCGKSTIFNMLTGAKQHIANFPGVTVEKKYGTYKTHDNVVEVVDLPGTYSLTSYSPEERISRDFILLEKPEVVVNIVDASNIARHLFLTFQLLEMGVPTIICLNMSDVAEKRGFKFDYDKLSELLGVPVVPTVGKKEVGKEELLKKAEEVFSKTTHKFAPMKIDYGNELEKFISQIVDKLQQYPGILEHYDSRWIAIKILEGDPEIKRLLTRHSGPDQKFVDFAMGLKEQFEKEHQASEIAISTTRHEKAHCVYSLCVQKNKKTSQTTSDNIDKYVLNKFWGPIILIGILLAMYQVTIGFGEYILGEYWKPILARINNHLSMNFPVNGYLQEGLTRSMFLDGIVAGTFAVLAYIPTFLLLFCFLAILEDSGYMARIAFLMDKLLRPFGLHGQSTLPMLMGGVIVGGCVAPGVMACRGIKDNKSRMVTILIMPLMNCLAKIPFYVLIVSLFFDSYKQVVLLSISLFSFTIALFVAKIFSLFIVKGEQEDFLLELPSYHMPTIKGVTSRAWTRMWHFVKKVVTIIAIVSVIVWYLVTFPGLSEYQEQQLSNQLVEKAKFVSEKVSDDNPYRKYTTSEEMLKIASFQELYDTWVNTFKSEMDEINKSFHQKHPEYFQIIHDGKNLQGEIDDNFLEVALAYEDFYKFASNIKTEKAKETLENSYAGKVGKSIEPVSKLAGLNWKINVAIASSLAAKENMASTLGTIYSVESNNAEQLSESIKKSKDISMLHAFALLIIVALFPPCLPAMIVIKNETNLKWAVFASVYPVVLGFILAAGFYQIGTLFGF